MIKVHTDLRFTIKIIKIIFGNNNEILAIRKSLNLKSKERFNRYIFQKKNNLMLDRCIETLVAVDNSLNLSVHGQL